MNPFQIENDAVPQAAESFLFVSSVVDLSRADSYASDAGRVAGVACVQKFGRIFIEG